jgi:hypothetical protein
MLCIVATKPDRTESEPRGFRLGVSGRPGGPGEGRGAPSFRSLASPGGLTFLPSFSPHASLGAPFVPVLSFRGRGVYWKYFATRILCKMCVLWAYEGDMGSITSKVVLYIIYYQK